MPWEPSSLPRVAASWSKAASSSNEPGTKVMSEESCSHTSSRQGVRACSRAASRATSAKSSSSHSRRAKPRSAKLVGSRPRLARSYTAGNSFLRARSPVMPNTTRAHGGGTRGSRRSRGSRSGLGIMIGPRDRRDPSSGPAGGRTAGGISTRGGRLYPWPSAEPRQELVEPGGAVGQVQVQQRPLPIGEGLAVTAGLRRLEGREAVRLIGHLQVLGHHAGELEERPDLRTTLVVLAGRVQEARPPPEGDRVVATTGQGRAQPLGVRVLLPVEIGHDREVPPRGDRRKQRVDRKGHSIVRGQVDTVEDAAAAVDLDGADRRRGPLVGEALAED